MNGSERIIDKRANIRVGYLCVFLALALAVCALGCISVISSCEPNARYFDKSPITVAFAVALTFTIVASFSSLFIFDKERLDLSASGESCARVAKYSNAVPALLALCVTVFALFDEVLGEWGNAVMILGAITTLFFVLKVLPRRFTAATVISGFGVFALGAVIIASLYFDLTIEINSPFKLLVQFGAVGMMLGTMADLRSLLSPRAPEGFKLPDKEFIKIGVRGFVFLKSLALTLCLVCAAVTVLYFIKGNTAFGVHYLVYSILYLAYAISAATELIVAGLMTIKSHI